jgi:hypothetical protein
MQFYEHGDFEEGHCPECFENANPPETKMSNQVTKAVTEEAAYQLFKNLFRFKDIKSVKEGLQRAIESRFEEASEGENPQEALAAECHHQDQVFSQLHEILVAHLPAPE